MTDEQLKLRTAFATRQGGCRDNQDFTAIMTPSKSELALGGIVAAVADGMGGARGGRVAAELCVRGFMEAWYGLPQTLAVEQKVRRALGSINRWLYAQGRSDPALCGMGTTFSAVIFLGRRAHLVHVGDSRIYRLRNDHLELLTRDHTPSGHGQDHILLRAVGLEPELRIDYCEVALEAHDRFLLSSDGLCVLKQAEMARLLQARTTPELSVEALADRALALGSQDNVTVLMADVISLPAADRHRLRQVIDVLPVRDLPREGDMVDGFRLEYGLSSGRYSRLFVASDTMHTAQRVVLKFPHPRVVSEREYHDAFLREAWIGARVKSPWVVHVLEQPESRQTCLYSVMTFHQGITLEQWLDRHGHLGLAAGIDLALKLCRAVHALHRQGIVHRDIKPDNVLLTGDGGLKLLDLGIARLPAWDEEADAPVPGTPSYMAPELFQGERGTVASDLFALGVTLYRLFSRTYPYGEMEPFSAPRLVSPKPLTHHRPDLPAWLDRVVARAIDVKPSARYADSIELACELESGLALGGGKPHPSRPPSCYERNPLLFWKLTAVLLFFGLITCLFLLASG